MTKRVVLAYSGGVDTTACIPYLREEMGADFVVAMAVDLGQGAELGPVREKALSAGADVSVVVDAKERFVREFGFPAVRANALYDGQYPLSSALGRPLIGELLVETAHAYRCGAVAHGCTGKGNDQVRLDLTVGLLDSRLEILAPARVWPFSRAETIAYSEKFGIEPHVTKEKPWAVDLNVLGRNVEAGPIEDLSWEPTEEVWALTTAPEEAPDHPAYVTVGFDAGTPVSLDGERLPALVILERLNALGGNHGVGRIDMLENRVVGVKSRELYEAPGMLLLIRAHQELENLALPADVLGEKRRLEAVYGKAVYDGLWHGPLRAALDAFFDSTQRTVTGAITLKLYKGGVSVAARNAERSLYRHELVTYGSDCVFDQSSAEGFIDIFGLPSRVWNQVNGG
ncbi:argininosuccinate synthase [Streptomyces sp. NPDC035033]|uniref:argininosuccinate synthase n=1 Tax=Streptomyces sp. NPDC035033 TaxID=3155368 RepID=UPI0033D118AA